jgi:hypothetical protein
VYLLLPVLCLHQGGYSGYWKLSTFNSQLAADIFLHSCSLAQKYRCRNKIPNETTYIDQSWLARLKKQYSFNLLRCTRIGTWILREGRDAGMMISTTKKPVKRSDPEPAPVPALTLPKENPCINQINKRNSERLSCSLLKNWNCNLGQNLESPGASRCTP